MFFLGIFAVSAILIAFIEQNVVVALTGSIAALSNTGPAFDSVIGPLGSYESLKVPTKLILIFKKQKIMKVKLFL